MRVFALKRVCDVRLVENVAPVVVRAATLLRYAILIALLAACANAANLVRARSVARRSEFATRLALGASRAALILEMTTDAAFPAFDGVALGVPGAVWATRVINRTMHLPLGLMASLNVRVDGAGQPPARSTTRSSWART